MKNKRHARKQIFTLAAAFASVAMIVVSCAPTEFGCDDYATCPRAGASGIAGGGGSGGAQVEAGSGGARAGSAGASAGSGGAASGASGHPGEAGATAAAGTDQGGAGGSTLPCNGACPAEQPICNETTDSCVQCLLPNDCQTVAGKPACDFSSNACVECTDNPDCKDSTKLLCDKAAKHCVACLQQSDCKLATASKCGAGACQPCTMDADCSNITGKGVCDAGTCVQCTGRKFDACGQNAGTSLVCDSLKRTCTMNKVQSAGLCQPCVADAQCDPGEMCVLDKFGSPAAEVGYFCHWRKGAQGAPLNCSVTGMPYVATQVAATSVDGVVSDLCTLAVSTCVARNQFRSKDCGVASSPSDAVCGIVPTKDAKCVVYDAGANTFRCTMTCGSDDDCPAPFTCNTGVSPAVCRLQ